MAPDVAEWIARVYRNGAKFRVVVEGLLSFDTDELDRIEERTALEIVEHLRTFFPRRAAPRDDPTAERVMEFEVAVSRKGTAVELKAVALHILRGCRGKDGRQK